MRRSSSLHSGLDFNSDAGRVTVCISRRQLETAQPPGDLLQGPKRARYFDSCSRCAQESEGRLSSKQQKRLCGRVSLHLRCGGQEPIRTKRQRAPCQIQRGEKGPGAPPCAWQLEQGLGWPITVTVYRHRSRRQQNDRQQIIKKKTC